MAISRNFDQRQTVNQNGFDPRLGHGATNGAALSAVVPLLPRRSDNAMNWRRTGWNGSPRSQRHLESPGSWMYDEY